MKGQHLCPRLVEKAAEGQTTYELSWKTKVVVHTGKKRDSIHPYSFIYPYSFVHPYPPGVGIHDTIDMSWLFFGLQVIYLEGDSIPQVVLTAPLRTTVASVHARLIF